MTTHPEPRTTVVNVKTDEYDIYIGRRNNRYGLPESDWANPYVIGRDGTRDEVIQRYRDYLRDQPELLIRLSELRGKRLGCWCAPNACHGHVLAELADVETEDE